ncbi:MAG: MFS transporter [Steroidobacteraceae bacterium]
MNTRGDIALGDSLACEQRAGAAAWWSLAVLVAINLFAFIDRQMLSLVAAPLAGDLKLSNAQLGELQGLGLTIFAVFFTYPLGWLADRFDRRAMLGVSLVVWAVGTAACGFAQGFVQLFLATVAIAAGEAGLAPLILSVIPDLFEGRERTTANLVYYVASGLGMSLGYGLGGLMIAAVEPLRALLPAALVHFESWRLAFVAVAAPAPLFLLLLATTRMSRRTRMEASVAAPTGLPIVPYVKAHRGTLLLVFGFTAIFMFAFGSIFGWIPFALTRIWGLSPAQDGMAMGIVTAATTIAGTLAAWLLMRRFAKPWGPAAPLRLGLYAMLIVAPTLILSPFAQSSGQLLVLVGCLVTAGTLVGSLLPNVLQDMAPAKLRGRVFAIYALLIAPTSGLSIMSVGGLSDLLHMGSRNVLFAITIIGMPAWIIGAAFMHFAQRPFVRTVGIVRQEGPVGAS